MNDQAVEPGFETKPGPKANSPSFSLNPILAILSAILISLELTYSQIFSSARCKVCWKAGPNSWSLL